MEAVELARQRAAAMHDAAIAGGADPWDPIEIVMAVAADKGLDVEPVGESGSLFQWSIRKNGKLHQRSDRKHPTEAKARAHGEAEIERLIRGRGR